MENLLVAEGLAQMGSAAAEMHIERHRAFQAVEADAVLARLRLRQVDLEGACRALESAFIAFRHDPWPAAHVMARALSLAEELAKYDAKLGARLFAATSAFALDLRRLETRAEIAKRIGSVSACVEAWLALEPHVPWFREQLVARRECYERASHPLAPAALRDEREASRCASRPAPITCW